MSNKQIVLSMLLLTSIAATPAFAQEAETAEVQLSQTWQQLNPAWTGVSNKVVEFVGEAKQVILADLAYAAVAGDICQTVELDKVKFKSAFDDGFTPDSSTTVSAEERTLYGNKVSMFFGVYVGLLTAYGLMDRASFCGFAEQMMTNGENQYWLTRP